MYQALYRKYRPKCFSDIYGQDHIVTTLKNEINENRVSHAYLFTGSRGTGKTTCAKVLAKAVNCPDCKDGEPCNECDVCRGIDNGSILDVVEIDAASNNGVDNIRELREEVNYTPTTGKYRVYIIDEVHMLSQGAYNALLKTLEEPPSHVIFILATTEVHKIPTTILSRCQRFDFKRIQPETMAKRLDEVARYEGLTLDADAALLISRLADGALRDGLSILDQCAGRSSSIDSALVSQVAGLTGRTALFELTNAVLANDTSAAMNKIAQLYENSYDMGRLCTELINHYRNCLVAKAVKNSRELIVSTEDEYNAVMQTAEAFSAESIVYGLDLLQSALVRIKSGANARIEMEMTFVKLCEPKLSDEMPAVLDRLSRLEKNGVKAPQAQPVPQVEIPKEPEKKPEPVVKEEPEKAKLPEETSEPETKTEPETKPEPEDTSEGAEAPSQEEPQPEAPQPQSDEEIPFDKWAEFLDEIHNTDIAIYGVINSASGFIKGDYFVISTTNPTLRQFIKIPTHAKAIKAAVYAVTGVKYRLAISGNSPKLSENKRDALEDLISQAQGRINIKFED